MRRKTESNAAVSFFLLEDWVQRFKHVKDADKNLADIHMLAHAPVPIESCVYYFQTCRLQTIPKKKS